MSFDLNARIARAKQARLGLTLIELIVVLVILVGLGGLLVPTINSALTRTHVATCATTFPEVHQMMQRVQLEFGQFGTNFDSGIHTGGDIPVNDATDATYTAEGSGLLQVTDLTTNEVAGLAAVGITSVVDHNSADPDFNVTFNIGATPRDLATDASAITLTDAQAQSIFLPTGGTPAQKYVWFGIGRNWSLLGSLAPEPPSHFGDAPGALPDEVHSRFGIIMEVFDEVDAPAQFKRVSFCIDGDVFETGDNHVENYYKEVNPRGT